MGFNKQFFTKPPVGSRINWRHPLAKDLVSCWLMNEGAGTRTRDLARQSNGTFGAGTATPTWRVGKYGQAVDFDGADDHIVVGNNAFLINGRSVFTILAIVTFDSVATNKSLCGSYTNSANTLFLQTFSSSNLAFGINSGSYITTAASSMAVGIPSAIVAQFNNARGGIGTSTNKYSIYLNGKPLALTANGLPGDFTAIGTPTPDFRIGDVAGLSRYLDGRMELFVMWHRDLAASEIAELYGNPFAFIKKPQFRFAKLPRQLIKMYIDYIKVSKNIKPGNNVEFPRQ